MIPGSGRSRSPVECRSLWLSNESLFDMQRMIDEKVFEGQHNNVILNEPNSPYSTPIKDFYRGKCILLTGGTGFIGRLLAEKLLR